MKAAITVAWLLFLASIPLWLGNPYILHVLVITGIFIVAAISLNLLLGYAGQLSLGHVAFFGIGAYASALVSLGFDVSFFSLKPKPVWVAMLAATVAAGLCGWVIGRLAFKVRGAYFVIVSISFVEVVHLVAVNWVELTQGPMALNNIPPLTVFGFSFLKKPENYWLILTVVVVCYVLVRRIVISKAGRAMIAPRTRRSPSTTTPPWTETARF